MIDYNHLKKQSVLEFNDATSLQDALNALDRNGHLLTRDQVHQVATIFAAMVGSNVEGTKILAEAMVSLGI